MLRRRDITAGRDLLLAAEGDITLESSQDLSTLHSQNQSSGASIGVAFSFGSSNGISFSASANQARGHANGDDTIQQNTHVTAARAIQIQSGADTTLAGATIAAPTVKADTGGNLRIESRQDTSTYTSAQKSSGMGVTLCIPPLCYGMSSVSGSTGKQNVNSDYRSVTEQSGIRAGDGGFQVNVGGNTTLTGGAITSSDLAVQEGLNSFVTGGTLTTTDIQNRADYKADGYSVNVTVAGGGTDKPPEGHEKRTQATPPTNSGSAGIGEDRGNASSLTTAGISGIAGNTALRTGDAEAGLTPIFDRDAVQREIDAQIKITAEFGKLASKAVGDLAGAKADDLRNQAKTESDPDKRQAMLDDAARWDEGGAYRSLAHAVIGGLTGGASGAAGAGAAALSADKINQAMAGLPDGVRNAVGAAIATGIGAAAGGVAGAATAFNEDLNNRQLHESEYQRAQRLAKNGAVQSALSKREGREVSADEIEGRIVAEILRNSDQSAAEQSGGIHDYGLRAVIGCQNLNCDGYKSDPNYSDANYNVQYIAPNSNSYAKGISFDGTGQTYNQLVKQNVKDNPVSTGIAGVALVGTGVAVAGPAALVPRAIAGGTGVAASAGFQLLGSQPMDWWDLGIAGVTGFVTGGASSWAQGVTAATAINTGGALAGSAIKGENPNGAMAGAAVGSVAGYAVGKIVEKPLSSVYNPWWLPNWIPVGLFGMVKPNVPSVVPGAVGGVGSSLVQESVGSGTKDGVNKYQGP